MGLPDLIIVFNNGEVSFFIRGTDYKNREEAINIGIKKWNQYIAYVMQEADKPEELNLEIRSINIYEIFMEDKV